MAELIARDTVSGQKAKAFATINGNVEELFYAKKLEAKFEKEKVEIKTLGRTGTQSKAVGWKGTGTMTLYYVTSMFRKMAMDFIKTGKDVYFTLQVENDDPASSIGTQTVVLYNVNLDGTVLAKFDTDSQALDEEVSFTFDHAEMLDQFGKPVM